MTKRDTVTGRSLASALGDASARVPDQTRPDLQNHLQNFDLHDSPNATREVAAP